MGNGHKPFSIFANLNARDAKAYELMKVLLVYKTRAIQLVEPHTIIITLPLIIMLVIVQNKRIMFL